MEKIPATDQPVLGLNLNRIEFEIRLGPDVHSLGGAFAFQEDLEYVNLQVTSNITDLSFMFCGAHSFNQPVGNWDTSNVTDMSGMFMNAEAFNQPIGDWDTSKVSNMRFMLSRAKSFNQPVDGWNISNVEDSMLMFYEQGTAE